MKDYIELIKPRITVTVMLTAFFGYWFAGGSLGPAVAWMLLAVGLASSASGCFNQLLEKEQDACMQRTCRRPLPTGRVNPKQALFFGLGLAVAGLAILAWQANTLTCVLTALTIGTYIFAYTPLKTRTPLSTWFGAVAGAAPPLIGWTAARGSLEFAAWMLFAIQFFWQIPHFLALFWLYREDYQRAGFRVMPVLDPSGGSTALQITLHSFALLLASMVPVFSGLAGIGYGLGALALGSAFLALGWRASWTLARPDMRKLFLASLAYLPVLFMILSLGRGRGIAGRLTGEDAVAHFTQVPDFELKDQTGRSVRRSDIEGPWVANFIFTRCSNQCPLLTANMRVLKEQLPDGVRMVSFSVDPKDTPEVLARYTKHQRADWLFLTGTKEKMRELCLQGFRLPVADSANPKEPILHAKSLVLVDKRGMIRGYFDGMQGDSHADLIRTARQLVSLRSDATP